MFLHRLLLGFVQEDDRGGRAFRHSRGEGPESNNEGAVHAVPRADEFFRHARISNWWYQGEIVMLLLDSSKLAKWLPSSWTKIYEHILRKKLQIFKTRLLSAPSVVPIPLGFKCICMHSSHCSYYLCMLECVLTQFSCAPLYVDIAAPAGSSHAWFQACERGEWGRSTLPTVPPGQLLDVGKSSLLS